MTSLTTRDVTVSAQSSFQEQFSQPTEGKYVFTYQIRIHNAGNMPVKLLSRSWDVISATGERRRVEGEGVVGQQPTILPGDSYEYTSWVQFDTPVGAMEGNYLVVRTTPDGREVFMQIAVPKFLHLAPEILN